MFYDSRLRNNSQVSEFDHNSECIWVVYPPGYGGDLWASIIGLHYPNTGNEFLGIDHTGRVILNTIDGKWLNFKLIHNRPIELDQKFLNQVNRGYQVKNFPRSMAGQTIFANHLWRQEHVTLILDTFPNARVIRILPGTEFETKIGGWMAQWKNLNTLSDFDTQPVAAGLLREITSYNYSDTRLLDVKFGSMWSESGFETVYEHIVRHLDLPYKLVKYDLLKFWFECQHETIRPELAKLFQGS